MSATSPSRLGLDIAVYDQVIALSQDNINQTLEYHYDNHEELKNFEAKLATATKEALRGKIDAPTIELIDKEGADQAFYCLVFTEGFYSWWRQQIQDPNAPVDPDAPPASSPWVQEKIPVKGWKLAFYVDFAMKKMDVIPEKIKSQITIPGSYGVDQLLIDFGTADSISFSWERSVISGFTGKEDEVAARDVISLFVTRWLSKVKSTEGNHNVLGYAVKGAHEDSQSIPKIDPSYPPTAVRLQTINYVPEGDGEKPSPENGRNAFLFTEMTGKDGPARIKAADDLAWSGDFFYDSLGGTLVMSRRIFWDNFVKPKLQTVNRDAILALQKVAKKLATPELASHIDWCLSDSSNDVGQGEWSSTDGLAENYTWKGGKYFDVEHEVPGLNHMYEYWIGTLVNHQLVPEVGTGKILFKYDISLKTTLKLGLYGMPKDVTNFTASTDTSYSGTLTIDLTAIDSQGGLSVSATDSASTPTIQVNATMDGIAVKILQAVPWIGSMFSGEEEVNRMKNEITTIMQSSIQNVATTRDELEAALSGQKQFVFPGGGTFDMKSPIFSKKGDLLIGLSYRQGD